MTKWEVGMVQKRSPSKLVRTHGLVVGNGTYGTARGRQRKVKINNGVFQSYKWAMS